jgi:Cu/Zn superoxide dismutase
VKKGGTLTALIETAPGYTGLPVTEDEVWDIGDLHEFILIDEDFRIDGPLYELWSPNAFGTASISCNNDGSFLFHIDAIGLDTNCNMDELCKVAIYDGTSCETEIAMGEEYYNGLADPWSADGDNAYFTYSEGGSTSSAFNFDNGYTCDENEGKVVVVFDSSSTIAACGVLGAKAKGSVLKAEMGVFPNYTGELEAKGKVKVTFNDDDTFQFRFDIKGLEEDCVDCAMHIHEGTSCEEADEGAVGGHFFNREKTFDLDTGYTTDDDGKAKGTFIGYNGYGIEENHLHVVVLHAKNMAKVACGVLEFD